MGKTKLCEFAVKRNEALFSLDYEKIVAFYREYGMSVPEDPLVFWLVVFKAICNIKNPDEDVLHFAQTWLRYYGFSEEIKFPLPKAANF